MKLHSDKLTTTDVGEAAEIARTQHGQDIFALEIMANGSRKRAGGVTFYCESQNGRRAVNRPGPRGRAASWDAWGYMIAELFNRDPDAIIGYYDGVADFRAQCERYQPRGATAEFLELVR